MRTSKALIAALLSTALLSPIASAQSLRATSQVYFLNSSDLFGPLDLYVDGVKTESNVFNSTPSLFPGSVAAGTHQLVVTKANAPLGRQDVFSQLVTLPAGGTYTLDLKNLTQAKGLNSVTGYTLDLSQGDADSQ